jgi:hypothetical protein
MGLICLAIVAFMSKSPPLANTTGWTRYPRHSRPCMSDVAYTVRLIRLNGPEHEIQTYISTLHVAEEDMWTSIALVHLTIQRSRKTSQNGHIRSLSCSRLAHVTDSPSPLRYRQITHPAPTRMGDRAARF